MADNFEANLYRKCDVPNGCGEMLHKTTHKRHQTKRDCRPKRPRQEQENNAGGRG